MDHGLTKQSTVVIKGESLKVVTGAPFVETIAEIAERYGLSQFTVRLTDSEGATFEVDLHRPPTLVPANSTISITPYDRPGLSL